MSVLNQSGEEQVECPLCMEPLEVDDLNFFPCTCGYQICRFCWHRIRTDENGLCPACRKAYPENPADFKPLSKEEVAKLKAEKRHKDQQRKQKITENRKHLANVRVVQRNLVFVVGLPMRLADSEVLKKHEYFGKFGKIHKVVINQSTSYAGSQGPSASAYVTYHKADDALRAIQAVNNILVDGRTVKTSLGTTKYCSHFMKNQTCPKPDCMYLHDLGDVEASFTKEEMQQGKHQDYERKLHEQLLNSYNQVNKESGTNMTVNTVQVGQSANKEAWPSLQPGVPSGMNCTGSSTSSISSNSSISSCNNSIGSSAGSGGGTVNSHHGSSKSERRQKLDHMSSKSTSQSHKKRHGVEDHRGKSKDKLHTPVAEDHSNKTLHNKSNHSNSRVNTKSTKEMYHDVQKVVTRCQNQAPAESNSASTQSVDVRVESEVKEGVNEQNTINSGVSNEGSSSRGSASGGRALPASHRAATLFEPDNNSFFSSNTFTKVSASAAGSAGPEWPLSSLTLAHMPDVLPPVHSSEDWQAAFGFSNSAPGGPSNESDGSSQQVAAEEKSQAPSTEFSESKEDENCVSVNFESQNDQQVSIQGFNCHNSHSSENIETNIVQNSSEEFRISEIGHLNQKLTTFTLEDGNGTVSNGSGNGRPGSVTGSESSSEATSMHSSINYENSNVVPCNPGNLYPNMPASAFNQDPTIYMVNRHPFLPSTSHIVPNGIQPVQAAKFLSEYHLRQQNQTQTSQPLQQVPIHLHNHTVLEGTNYNRSLIEGGVNSKFGLLNLNSFGGSADIVSLAKCPNGTSSESEDTLRDDDKYSNYEGLERQKSENSSDEYVECSGESENGVQESEEEIVPKESQRTTDDDLGFDPFHETQKALAEMMEKENMMLMLQGQQSHVPHPNHHVNHINQLHQQYQHINRINHSNHYGQGALFGSTKGLPGYNASVQTHHLSQNHRLQTSVSGIGGCSKLVDGLTLGPGSIPPRTRLPPPGFATAPNHMNAFGLGIPRAPANTGSKILPFMGLGNGSNSTNTSPIPQSLNTLSNNISLSSLNSQPSVNSNPVLFPHSSNHNSIPNHLNSSFGAQNGGIVQNSVQKATSDSYNVKEWPDNLRSVLPHLNSGNGVSQSPVPVGFSGSNTPTPPPAPPTSSSHNSSFIPPSHAAVQSNKTWSGAGPCSDWTALDPAIMSSRPHSYLGSNHVTQQQHPVILCNTNAVLNQQSPNAQYLHLQNTTHWLRSLASEGCLLYGANISQNISNSDWTLQNHSSNSIAPPPPGFSLRMSTSQQTSVQNKLAVSAPPEITKIENL